MTATDPERSEGSPEAFRIGWPNDAQPHIVWTHIDGPLLSMRTGEIHWLTLWERVQFSLGLTDIYKLECKYSTLLSKALPDQEQTR